GGYDVWAFDPSTGRQGHTGGLTVAANDQVVPGDVTLEARGGVLGHLYDPDVTPPLGLPVATVSLQSYGVTSLLTYSSTDLSGAFQFQGIPQGNFTLAAREPQGRRNASGQGAIAHEGDQVTVDLYLQKEGTVSGSALNPAGATSGKYPNVNVIAVQDGQVIGGVLASDYSFGGIIVGRPFEIDAQEVGGHHAGAARGTLADSNPVTLDVQMVPIGSVRVVVQDSFGTPVPGADVTLYTNGFYGFHVLRASSSGAADAIFQDIGASALGVEVYDPVSMLHGSASGSLATDGEIVQLVVKLESTGTIQGTVVLADGVTPAAGATAGLRVSGRSFLVQVDGAGAFVFRGVPLGGFDLNLQQSFGPGTLEVLGNVAGNGQVIDLGTLVLDATDLQVLTIVPADGATNVPLTQTIAVTFNKPIDPNRNLLGNAVQVIRSDGQYWSMNGSLSADGKTILLAPGRPFDNATTYLVRANQGIYAVSGRQLPQPAQASFTTVDHLAPAVIHMDPAAGAVQVPLGVQLHLIFNRPVDPTSLSGAHLQLLDLTTGVQVATTFTPLVNGRELLITPQTALAQEQQYQLTVQGMVDLVGNVQAQPFVSTFYSLDATPPRFGAVLPAPGTVYTAGDPVAISVAASDP
ncbi:MAG TPA: Ig-like domain-containing protein, partial [Thermoanaerobaculia bacterium]|nr:Ig-like domain-containing protein [Thermoanaerobaculia bacterium]